MNRVWADGSKQRSIPGLFVDVDSCSFVPCIYLLAEKEERKRKQRGMERDEAPHGRCQYSDSLLAAFLCVWSLKLLTFKGQKKCSAASRIRLVSGLRTRTVTLYTTTTTPVHSNSCWKGCLIQLLGFADPRWQEINR